MASEIAIVREKNQATIHLHLKDGTYTKHVFERKLVPNDTFQTIDFGKEGVFIYNKMDFPMTVELVGTRLLVLDAGGASICFRLSEPITSLRKHSQVKKLDLDFHMGIFINGSLTFISAY